MKKKYLILFFSFAIMNHFYFKAISDLYIDTHFNLNKVELVLNAVDYASETLKIANTSGSSEKDFLFSYGLDAFNKFLMGCNEFHKWTGMGCLMGSKEFFYSGNDIAKIAIGDSSEISEQEKLMQFIWLSLNKFMPLSIYSIGRFYWFGGNFGKPLFNTTKSEETRTLSFQYMHYFGVELPF